MRLRIQGAYLGLCRCGCDTPVFEGIWLRNNGGLHGIVRPAYVKGHALRLYGAPGASAERMAEVTRVRMTKTMCDGNELLAFIRAERRRLGISVEEMAAKLGYRHPGNLNRTHFQGRIQAERLQRILGALFASENGWVEAAPVWRLVASKRTTWGWTAEEMSVWLGATEGRWMGKEMAARILWKLSGPRPASAYERALPKIIAKTEMYLERHGEVAA